MKTILERLKSPIFWVGVASVLGIIFSTANVDPSTINTWSSLFGFLWDVLKDPFTLFSIVAAVFAFMNNPTNKTGF